MFIDYLSTPLGLLKIGATEQGITEVIFIEDTQHLVNIQPNTFTQKCQQQLNEYFNKKRQLLDLPLIPRGTVFQKKVWTCLSALPYAHTCSYSDIASQLNNAAAVRAVGAANGRNPIAIIIPCHRVIGRDGSLTGYAGGLQSKEWLLAHEGALIKEQAELFA